MKLTAERLREVLHYDASTGEFTWKKKPSERSARAKVGSRAGWVVAGGYRFIGIDGEKLGAHRLAVMYATGVMPSETDHIDGDPTNNRLANLREVTHRENMQNMRRARKQNRSGTLGVSLHPTTGRYRAAIEVDGERRHLGYHATAEEAHAAYLAAKRHLHEGNTL